MAIANRNNYSRRSGNTRQRFLLFLCLLAGLIVPGAAAFQASAPAGSEAPELSKILEKMAEHKNLRDREIRSYGGDRVYRVENKRLGKEASVSARMVFLAPDEKLFSVQSYTGSGFMRKGVLNRMIETERQSARKDLAEKSAILPSNYEFKYLRQESVKGRPQYVLRAAPRVKDGLLFDGTIWVDCEDHAVTRIEARPAKNPSFWTRKVDFVHEYERYDGYWFPVKNSSVTSVFLFGRTTTEIVYSNYRINQPALAEEAAEIRKRGERLEIQLDSRDAKQSPVK
jgi:outer membrane lipoprotein-sorting protein